MFTSPEANATRLRELSATGLMEVPVSLHLKHLGSANHLTVLPALIAE
jgi:hypothetical protein